MPASDLFLCNVVDVHLFQRTQEARLGHHGFGRLPRDLFDALEYDDTLADRLHRLRRLGERPDFGYVVLVEVIECKPSGLQRRQRVRQYVFRFSLKSTCNVESAIRLI